MCSSTEGVKGMERMERIRLGGEVYGGGKNGVMVMGRMVRMGKKYGKVYEGGKDRWGECMDV